ncbi:MAG TPA: hypothetical protein VFE17_13480 [Candidatus Baltobacteraceae bacterium]|nr:hypothetical protein [Candidatus Baltobacteraceae bacterium]
MRGRWIAALCAIFLITSTAAVFASAQQASPQVGTFAGGGTYVVHPDGNAPTVAVDLWYRAPSAGYDNATPGISRLAVAAVAASAPLHGTSLAELITRVGGSLSLNVYPDIVMVGVSVPSWQLAPVLHALTGAYFSPQISEAGYRTAVRDCAVAAAESHFDSDRLLQDALFVHLFSSGPGHVAPIPGSAQDFARIPLAQAQTFAQRAFRRSNVTLAITGSVAGQWLSSAAAPSLQNGVAAGDPPFDSTPSNANVDVTQVAQVTGVGLAWTGPPIADPKAATAMDFVADYLFDADHGTVATALRKRFPQSFINGQFITLHNPGVLVVTASGAPAPALRAAIADAVNAMQQPLGERDFQAARTAFIYHILSQTQTPASQADNFGWYGAEGNLEYAPSGESSEYFTAARALDPGYVSGTVKRYLQKPAVVQLISTPHGTTT